MFHLVCFQTQCVAVDKSQIACNLTRINAEDHSLQGRLDIIEGNIFEGSVFNPETIHPRLATVQGPYSPSILKTIFAFFSKIFQFECNTTFDWLNHVV